MESSYGDESLRRFLEQMSREDSPAADVPEEMVPVYEFMRSPGGDALLRYLVAQVKPLVEMRAVDVKRDELEGFQNAVRGIDYVLAELEKLREPVKPS